MSRPPEPEGEGRAVVTKTTSSGRASGHTAAADRGRSVDGRGTLGRATRSNPLAGRGHRRRERDPGETLGWFGKRQLGVDLGCWRSTLADGAQALQEFPHRYGKERYRAERHPIHSPVKQPVFEGTAEPQRRPFAREKKVRRTRTKTGSARHTTHGTQRWDPKIWRSSRSSWTRVSSSPASSRRRESPRRPYKLP